MVISLYVVALLWLWWAHGIDDWYANLTKACLLVVLLGAFACKTLNDSGAPAIRRAKLLADRLARRRVWPADLGACRTLPEVKALRSALTFDAATALALLQDTRAEVQVAALSALESRRDWQPGQVELVLQAAQLTDKPTIRAVAIAALSHVDKRSVIEAIALFLSDASPIVRRAAIEALLWDTERRWPWIRHTVRQALADPVLANDGALTHEGQLLSPEAVNDLTGWCAEKGCLAVRSALTLSHHYARALSDESDLKVSRSLQQVVANAQAPAVLRIELGRLLQLHQELDLPLLKQLLHAGGPGPLRLVAVEMLLTYHRSDKAAKTALTVLRDLARSANREIALATAYVIQRSLGVDLGLAVGQPLPAVNSPQAADIARRVMAWGNQSEVLHLDAEEPPSGVALGRQIQTSKAP
jgi:hypothetical protein